MRRKLRKEKGEDAPWPQGNMQLLAKHVGISRALLVKANDESRRLGFNRTLDLDDLPDHIYGISAAATHIGFNGGDHDSLNVRLFLWLPKKPLNGPTLPEHNVALALLDVTTDTWGEILRAHKRRTKKVRGRPRLRLVKV